MANTPVMTFLPPLRRAWRRMVDQLFHPFDPSKWIIVGFTCWLVRLGESGGGGGGAGARVRGGPARGDLTVDTTAITSWFDTFELGLTVALVGCVLVVVIAVVLLVLWINARGHFMFLENVVHDRMVVGEPWREYRPQGNSLFLWRVGFMVLCVLAVFAAAAPGVLALISAERADSAAAAALGLVLLLVPVLLVSVALAYVDLFLTDFVVPIMYQRKLRTNDAWRVFLPHLKTHPADFLLYGLFVLGLHIAVVAVIVSVGLLTCCIPFLFLAIPVVGTLFLLPLHLTYRAFSLEFLAQLGPELRLFPSPTGESTPDTSPEASPPTPPPPMEGEKEGEG